MGEIGVHPIKLALVPAFRLGAVEVDPPARQLRRGERSEMLEPRVMQVLVVLAEARGMVVSREELIERCWDGRIVGENAINRVISRIRQAAADIGRDCFQLETITKVGYRIVAQEPQLWPVAQGEPREPMPPVPPDLGDREAERPSRRTVLGGALAAIGAAGAGFWLWRSSRGHVPHPEAAELHRRAQIAQRQGSADQVRQAISFFTRATEIDPLYAEAWGGLALSYRHILEGYAEAEMDSLPRLIESAARRALALDPDNADAQIALEIIKPYFRNWGTMEPALARLVDRHPDHWFALAQLGIVRYETGRWSEGLRLTERQIEVEPYIPIPQVVRARALWSLGRLQEAEAALNSAIQRWPTNYALWNLKFTFLLFTGRPGSAAAFVQDPETRPENLRPNAVDSRMVLARAVEQRRQPDIEASVADLRGQAAFIGSVPAAAPLLLLLGRDDLVLPALERYFFGGPGGELGPAVAPPSTFERRSTSFLFLPNLASLRGDPRFAPLLDRIGLERYWRESRTLPDFRRGG